MSAVVRPVGPEKADYLPQWTKHVVVDGGGRDPLGLSRVGLVLLDYLIPGIVLNTDRARYYALYIWMLWHIQEDEPSASVDEFTEGFQRRESAVALATLLANSNSSPVGVRATRAQLDRAGASGHVNTQFRVLPANRLGGFGQYYSGGLYELGMTHRLDDGIDRVTGGFATRLALAVEASVAKTPYVKRKLFRNARVELRDLKKSEELSVDAISDAFAKPERSLLTDLFFGFDNKTPTDLTLNRRYSLARILATISAAEAAGVSVGEKTLDFQLLFGPAYFGVLVDQRGRTKPFKVPDSLRRSTEFWRQFCLHQYLTQALEGLLDAMLRVLGAEPAGEPLQEIVRDLTRPGFAEHLRGMFRQIIRGPKELLKAVGVTTVPDDQASHRNRATRGFGAVPNEVIEWDDDWGPAEVTASCCIALAVLYGKWRGTRADLTYAVVAEKAGPEFSAPSILPLLDDWLNPELGWPDAITHLLELIVRQHDRVMYGKGRLESCWLHQDDARLVRDQSYEPYFRGSRHRQAVSILVDLGHLRWVEKQGSRQVVMTAQGGQCLRKALAEEA